MIMCKLMKKWGMVLLAVVVVGSLSLVDQAHARRPLDDGPIIGTDPDVETPGDNDGVAGIKYKFRDGGVEGGGLGSGLMLSNQPDDGVSQSPRYFGIERLPWMLMFWTR
jgi:hypothetical protein